MTAQASSDIEGVFATSQTIGLTKATFLTYILPPVVCLYLMGVLVQLDGTRIYRMALLPVTLCLAWRATLVDMSGNDPAKVPINTALITKMCVLGTRSFVWALSRVRYQRHSPVDSRNKSDNLYAACWNTWDLMVNDRGIGWNWSQGLVIPKPAFKTNSRVIFVLSTALRVVFHAVALDACVQIIRTVFPGTLKGGTLFDNTLPPILELLRAMLVSFLTAASIFFGLQHMYHMLAIVCIILFHQHPSQWPPLFDNPILSTSLNALWSRQWHQLMRDSVLNLGYKPFRRLLGRPGGLLGAFLVSCIFHNFDLGRRGFTGVCLCFWVMNAIGVFLERLWKRVTGRSVDGGWGWMWMAGWLLLWGVPMVDAYAQVGRLGALGVVGGFEPSLALATLVRKVFGMADFQLA